MTLYWYKTVDTAWVSLGNWWQDSGHSTPADALPGDGDDCILLGPVGPVVDVGDMIFTTPATIDSTGLTEGAVFTVQGAGMFDGVIITGDVTFRGSIYVSGSSGVGVSGDVAAWDTVNLGSNVNMTVGGNLYLFDYANAASFTMISGNAVCRGNSQLNGAVTAGNADFHDSSFNVYGTIAGNFTYHLGGSKDFGSAGGAAGSAPPIGNGSQMISGHIAFKTPPPALQPI